MKVSAPSNSQRRRYHVTLLSGSDLHAGGSVIADPVLTFEVIPRHRFLEPTRVDTPRRWSVK